MTTPPIRVRDAIRRGLGTLLVLAAAIGAALAVGGSVLYALFCVMWLHAPVAQVLLVTLCMMGALLGITWAVARLGKRLRRLA